MGHCHMVGGDASPDSERRIVIGGTEALPASMFGPDIAYAALGHLHLAQRVGQQAHLRYCGSPLPLSFAKSATSTRCCASTSTAARRRHRAAVRAARGRAAARAGQPAPVKQVIAELVALDLPDAAARREQPLPGSAGAARRARAGPARPGRGGAGRQARAPGEDRTDAPRGTTAGVEPALSLDQLAQLQPDDIFRRLWQQRFGEDAPDDQLAAFTELILPADGISKNREAA
jgi:exonuclease SbcD